MGEGGKRLGGDLALLGGAVDEVDGVNQHRSDLARGARFAKAGEVVVAVGIFVFAIVQEAERVIKIILCFG